jgi:glycosyltransferase involved in cell wall biosynthesis
VRVADAQPLVSIVVPTRNSTRTLAACLTSIRQQTYPHIELIVVDNRSTDGTRELASRLADRVLEGGPERSPQTNAGARAATGAWIYKVDSDFVLEANVVEEAVATAQRDSLDAVLIHNRSDESVSLWARARFFEREMYRDDWENVAARFVRRELFDELGGFDESLVAGEDYDLHARLVAAGARIGRIEASELHLGEPRSAGDVLRKHFYYGAHLRRYVKKRGAPAVRQLSPIRPAFVRNRARLARNPRDTLLLLTYLGLKYTAGAAGFLVGSARSREQAEHAHTGAVNCLLVSPGTEFGSWKWIEEVIENSPPEAHWYVVSYGRPARQLPNVESRCLPRVDYPRIGSHLSKRRLLFANTFYFLPLVPIAAWVALRHRPAVLAGNGIASLIAVLPFRARSTSAYLMFHSYTAYMGKRWDVLLRGALRLCDGAFVNSETSRDDLERVMAPDKITLVEHWADRAFFGVPLRRRAHARLRLLFVGRLDTDKFGQCLRVARVLSEVDLLELWLVGRGGLGRETGSIPHSRDLGYVDDRKELAKIYGAADVVWAPADTTYLSRPGIEALASGCPVIVSDVPAVAPRAQAGERVPRDLIPSEVGWVVDGVSDAEAIDLLRRLAVEGIPPGMRQAARDYAASRHSIANVHSVLEVLFPPAKA